MSTIVETPFYAALKQYEQQLEDAEYALVLRWVADDSECIREFKEIRRLKNLVKYLIVLYLIQTRTRSLKCAGTTKKTGHVGSSCTGDEKTGDESHVGMNVNDISHESGDYADVTPGMYLDWIQNRSEDCFLYLQGKRCFGKDSGKCRKQHKVQQCPWCGDKEPDGKHFKHCRKLLKNRAAIKSLRTR
eukprot:TRINITY_DN5818_c0_g1_i1.p1 TRINITY_DN5818_c0_g1~~TRINITY_DN5818_c0_g1_i1.p1  ORF type:complete len:188 (+),score=16.57 TRINITY_DN5818_c0_g1_i1:708-1271(+)